MEDKPQSWPGLDADRDDVTYSPQKIKAVASALREELEPLEGRGTHTTGSVSDLTQHGGVFGLRTQLDSISDWPGGKLLSKTLELGHDELVKVYGEVVTNFTTAISLIENGAGTYGITNVANEGEA